MNGSLSPVGAVVTALAAVYLFASYKRELTRALMSAADFLAFVEFARDGAVKRSLPVRRILEEYAETSDVQSELYILASEVGLAAAISECSPPDAKTKAIMLDFARDFGRSDAHGISELCEEASRTLGGHIRTLEAEIKQKIAVFGAFSGFFAVSVILLLI